VSSPFHGPFQNRIRFFLPLFFSSLSFFLFSRDLSEVTPGPKSPPISTKIFLLPLPYIFHVFRPVRSVFSLSKPSFSQDCAYCDCLVESCFKSWFWFAPLTLFLPLTIAFLKRLSPQSFLRSKRCSNRVLHSSFGPYRSRSQPQGFCSCL